MPQMLVELANYNLEQGALTMRAATKAPASRSRSAATRTTAGLELLRMIHHGLTPSEALRGRYAVSAAEALGLGEHVGTVEEGKLADLVDRRRRCGG